MLMRYNEKRRGSRKKNLISQIDENRHGKVSRPTKSFANMRSHSLISSSSPARGGSVSRESGTGSSVSIVNKY